jgi:O-antigen/teichoic acid export membrane protein
MDNFPELTTEEALRTSRATAEPAPRPKGWSRYASVATPPATRFMAIGYSFADQALAVGGSFLVNVALARTQSKEEYGMFALSYSVFTFLTGLHNAAILEPYTVFGSGRYRGRFSEYLRLMARSNALLGIALTGILLSVCLLLFWMAPQWVSRSLVGLGITVGFLLSGIFLRRAFYVQRQPVLAAKSSLVFFVAVACGLWLVTKAHRLDSLTAFLTLALGWITACAILGSKLRFGRSGGNFLDLEPHYWRQHWNYSKWVLATAFVFQLTTQGYYWLVAGFLSAKEVGELRAMYLLVAPVEQALIALSYLVVPALAAHYAAKRIGKFISLWKRFELVTVGLTGLFALVVWMFGKPLMHILYAGRYDGLVPYLFTLALVPLVHWIGSTMAQALNAVEQPRFVFWAYLCSGAATVFGGIPLVAHYGLWGAVYGLLLSGGVYTLTLAIGFVLKVCDKAQWQTAATLSQSLSPQPFAEEE